MIRASEKQHAAARVLVVSVRACALTGLLWFRKTLLPLSACICTSAHQGEGGMSKPRGVSEAVGWVGE